MVRRQVRSGHWVDNRSAEPTLTAPDGTDKHHILELALETLYGGDQRFDIDFSDARGVEEQFVLDRNYGQGKHHLATAHRYCQIRTINLGFNEQVANCFYDPTMVASQVTQVAPENRPALGLKSPQLARTPKNSGDKSAV